MNCVDGSIEGDEIRWQKMLLGETKRSVAMRKKGGIRSGNETCSIAKV